jgi:hypothetical protein
MWNILHKFKFHLYQMFIKKIKVLSSPNEGS